MKIALFALSIACLCFCGCSENHNDQQQLDPLTAPIQEVQALQQKIVVKIKDAEALNDEKIKVNNAKIADATIRGANDEVHAYMRSIPSIALERENATADLKAALPSNILVDKYKNVISKYPHLDKIQSLSPDDLDTVTNIIRVLDQISPSDAFDIKYYLDHLGRAEQAAKAKKHNQLILRSLPAVDSLPSGRWHFSITHRLNQDGEIVPKVLMLDGEGGIQFELTSSEVVLSNFMKFAEWAQKIEAEGGGDIQKKLGEFSDALGQTSFDFYSSTKQAEQGEPGTTRIRKTPGIWLDVKQADSNSGKIWSKRFGSNEVDDIKRLFAILPDLAAKDEQALDAKKLAAEKNDKMADELK
jgi:hypothetical protein